MAIVKKTKNGKTFYWDTVNKKFAKNPTSSVVKKVPRALTKPKTTSSSTKTTKLSKLGEGDIFKKPNNEQLYINYGRVKIYSGMNTLKGYGDYVYGEYKGEKEYYTENDISVILVNKMPETSSKKKPK
jgi:hypothetical protein